MSLYKLLSEVELVEKSVTDLVVCQVCLHALLYALQIGDSLHFDGQLPFAKVTVLRKLALKHSLHGRSLKLGHRVQGRLSLLPARLERVTRWSQHSPGCPGIREDSSGDAPLAVQS